MIIRVNQELLNAPRTLNMATKGDDPTHVVIVGGGYYYLFIISEFLVKVPQKHFVKLDSEEELQWLQLKIHYHMIELLWAKCHFLWNFKGYKLDNNNFMNNMVLMYWKINLLILLMLIIKKFT